MMRRDLKVFLTLPPFMFLLDYLWLGLAAEGLYKRQLAGFLRLAEGDLQPIVWAAILVYIALPVGIVLLALPRVSADRPVPSGLLWGAAYGLIVYTIYEMTNYSLLEGWPLTLVFIDTVWGTFLNAVTTAFAAFVRSHLEG